MNADKILVEYNMTITVLHADFTTEVFYPKTIEEMRLINEYWRARTQLAKNRNQ